MVGVTAAIIGSAVLGAGASIIGGNKAAKAQQQSAELSVAEQRRQYDLSRQDMLPWIQTGQGALSKLAGMYGVTPAGPPASAPGSTPGSTAPGGVPVMGDPNHTWRWNSLLGEALVYDPAVKGFVRPSDFTRPATTTPATTPATGTPAQGQQPYGGFFTSPGYQFRLDEGVKAVERSAAARGLLGSGATVKAIQRYGEGLASSEYENFSNRLAAMAGIGQTTAAQSGALGAQSAANIGQAYQAAGNARASSYANTASSINSGLNNMMTAYMFSQGGGFGR